MVRWLFKEISDFDIVLMCIIIFLVFWFVSEVRVLRIVVFMIEN